MMPSCKEQKLNFTILSLTGPSVFLIKNQVINIQLGGILVFHMLPS